MTLNWQTLVELTNANANTLVSVYMPMQRTGRERRQNLIRFRNLVDDAEKFLADEPDAAQAKKLLTALQRLRDDPEHPTWEHPGEGLAVLATHEDVHVFSLPVPVEEQVHVGERYYLKPLLRIVQEEGTLLRSGSESEERAGLRGDVRLDSGITSCASAAGSGRRIEYRRVHVISAVPQPTARRQFGRDLSRAGRR
jgi:hypothetical protein